MTPDSNGILYLEETDPITPFQTTINALQAATSAAIGDLSTDTGWTTLETAPGWSGVLSYRVRGGICYLKSGSDSTYNCNRSEAGSGVVSLATLPVIARPSVPVSFAGVTNESGGTAARLLLTPDGVLEAVTGGTWVVGRQLNFVASWPVD